MIADAHESLLEDATELLAGVDTATGTIRLYRPEEIAKGVEEGVQFKGAADVRIEVSQGEIDNMTAGYYVNLRIGEDSIESAFSLPADLDKLAKVRKAPWPDMGQDILVSLEEAMLAEQSDFIAQFRMTRETMQDVLASSGQRVLLRDLGDDARLFGIPVVFDDAIGYGNVDWTDDVLEILEVSRQHMRDRPFEASREVHDYRERMRAMGLDVFRTERIDGGYTYMARHKRYQPFTGRECTPEDGLQSFRQDMLDRGINAGDTTLEDAYRCAMRQHERKMAKKTIDQLERSFHRNVWSMPTAHLSYIDEGKMVDFGDSSLWSEPAEAEDES